MASDTLNNLQDVSAIGGLTGTDLMFGLRPGGPDDDFKVSLDDLTNYVSNTPILGTATASADSEVAFINGVNGVVFDSTYPIYHLEFKDYYRNAGTTETILIQFTDDTGLTWITTGAGNYEYASGWVSTGTDARIFNNQTLGYIAISNNTGDAGVTEMFHGSVYIFNPAAVSDTVVLSQASGSNVSAVHNNNFGGGVLLNRSVDGFRFKLGTASDTFYGEFTLRGIKI